MEKGKILATCSVFDPESQVVSWCSFVLNSPVSMDQVERHFPFEGEFSFRLKVSPAQIGLRGNDYIWVDLTRGIDLQNLVGENADCIELRVMVQKCLFVPSNEEYEKYLETASSYVSQARRTILEANDNIQSKAEAPSSKPLTLNNSFSHMKQGASSLWNTVKATAVQLQNTIGIIPTSHLSDNAEENLSYYSDLLHTNYTDKNNLTLLQDLWQGFFPQYKGFQRDSLVWKEAGFQTTNPINDLKGSGVLGLECLVYFVKNYPKQCRRMLNENRENVKSKYPFAIVGINLTLLFVDLFKLKDQMYLAGQSSYWGIFEDRKALFELFALAFLRVDHNWKEQKATRSDFGKIIGEVKSMIPEILKENPKNFAEVVEIGSHFGLKYYTD